MCSWKSYCSIWTCLDWWWCKRILKCISWANVSFVLVCKKEATSLYLKKYCQKVTFQFIDNILVIYLSYTVSFGNQSLINFSHPLSYISIEWVSRPSKMSKSLNSRFNFNSLYTQAICGWFYSCCCLSWLYCVWLCWLWYNWFNWLKLNWICINWLHR